MRKGVVILIIVGTLCYFGMRWYSKKHPEGSRFATRILTGRWVSPKDNADSEVIREKSIILETTKEKKAKPPQEPSVKGKKAVEAVHEPPLHSPGQEVKQPAVVTPEQHAMELAVLYIKEGKKYEARNLLSDAYLKETSETNRKQIKEKLDKLNEELVFSPSLSKDADVYVVKPGDTLIKIAKQYNTSYELIMRLNKKQNTNLRVNEPLKVLNGKVGLLVDKSDFTLTVLLGGHYIKQYPVGTGVAGKTPVGSFKIKDKLKNPVWYSPEGVYEYGHPKNILGTRWLGFEDKPGLHGYGIHGTTLPDTIGKESSMGCIRMCNEDVEELYDFVIPGAEVTIQE